MLGESRARDAATHSTRFCRRRPALRHPRPLTKAKMSNLAVSLDLMKRTSLEKHSDPIFCVSVLQILHSTTGRRQWFLISRSRPACRAWWTLELQIIHLTKVRSPNIRKHDVSVLIFHRLWTRRAQVIHHNAERQIKQNHCPLDFWGFSAYVVVRRKMCATKEMHFYKLWESHLPRKQKSFVWFV